MTSDREHQGGVAEYISSLEGSPRFGPQVVHHEKLAACDALFAELAQPLREALTPALSQGRVILASSAPPEGGC